MALALFDRLHSLFDALPRTAITLSHGHDSRPISAEPYSAQCIDFVTAVSMVLSRFQLCVFGTTAQIPTFRAASSRPSATTAVKRIIGTLGSEPDIIRAASRPLMSGIDRSSKTTSGFSSWNFL